MEYLKIFAHDYILMFYQVFNAFLSDNNHDFYTHVHVIWVYFLTQFNKIIITIMLQCCSIFHRLVSFEEFSLYFHALSFVLKCIIPLFLLYGLMKQKTLRKMVLLFVSNLLESFVSARKFSYYYLDWFINSWYFL